MKKFLSITLSVVFVLILAVIPAFARYTDYDTIIVSNKFYVVGTIAAENKYVEAGTLVFPFGSGTVSCMSCIGVTEIDGSGYSVASSGGMSSATATYDATSIYNSISTVATEHYGFYYSSPNSDPDELIVSFEIDKTLIQ